MRRMLGAGWEGFHEIDGAAVRFSWLDPYTQFAAARVERAARQFLADIADTP